MSLRGKLLREDYGVGYGRTREWPAYPQDLFPQFSVVYSTSVVCRECGSPTGGLRFDAEDGSFVHSDTNVCLLASFFSQL